MLYIYIIYIYYIYIYIYIYNIINILIYIADLFESVSNIFVGYADDETLVSVCKKPSDRSSICIQCIYL